MGNGFIMLPVQLQTCYNWESVDGRQNFVCVWEDWVSSENKSVGP